MVKPKVNFGNLESYKFYIKPTANEWYRIRGNKKITIHQKNIEKILRILLENGSVSTWEMAKIVFPNNLSKIRTREKEYRRLFNGRTDRGKYHPGIIDLGLIIPERKNYRNNQNTTYRLSPHGILYCLDFLELSNNEIDRLAKNYEKILPQIFEKWDELKKIFHEDVYKLRILSKGILIDNIELDNHSGISIYELMSYLNIKYKKNYDYITEFDLSEQISYWFYIFLLYDKKKSNNIKKIKIIFKHDKNTREWFFKFLKEAEDYYRSRINNLNVLMENF